MCWFLQVFEVSFGLLERLFGERVLVMHPIGPSFVACHDVELFPQLDFHVFLLYVLLSMDVCGCDRFKSSSIGDVVEKIERKDNYMGLMRGWIPRMLFHAPAAAICWSTYGAVKTFFQELNANTESGT
ncbi:uncharacterized protein LOC120147321 [Hibiscus syriacus]|uniref:uncharacterized protein LOC120147321 n=1 Tax=Hibiscus syriacus TaxID=106335 RepID=UPI001921AA45|nr:uncharacterized protein LOC120147321 [Hibiscus syriacus]